MASSLSLFQNLDLWKEKCSICFERHCDFCLPGCEDQFCLKCMRRYLQEVVDNSWGLAGCEIKCPVCHEILPKNIWTKYADRKTVLKFEAFNQPYRLFSRFCSGCGDEVAVSHPPPKPKEQKSLRDELGVLICKFSKGDEEWAKQVQETITKAQTSKKRAIFELYCDVSPKIWALASKMKESLPMKSASRKKDIDAMAIKILTSVISLEADPVKWRHLQYHHIKLNPKLLCEHCSLEMCFRCGEPTWHEGDSCQSYQARRAHACSFELSETIQWALLNGKRCPNCSVLIHREDGCNKVDCLYCGHMFCWICEQTWSSSCGFYRCSAEEPSANLKSHSTPTLPGDELDPISSSQQDYQPELGVPDVDQIERKLQAQQEARSTVNGTSAAASLLAVFSLILVILSLAFLIISLLNACLLFRLFDQEPPRPTRDPTPSGSTPPTSRELTSWGA